MIKQDLEKLIFNYEFDKAKILFSKLDEKKQIDTLCLIGYESDNILVYTFICYLLQENNTAKMHSLAAEILRFSLCDVNGAYQAAFYHTKKAIELSPNDINLKEYLLFFYEIPEKLLSKEEAIKIANEVLSINKKSQPAMNVIKSTKIS